MVLQRQSYDLGFIGAIKSIYNHFLRQPARFEFIVCTQTLDLMSLDQE